jgi:hypothetical protein
MKKIAITLIITFFSFSIWAFDNEPDSVRIQKLEIEVVRLSDYKEKMQYAYGVCAGLFVAFGLIIYFLDDSYKKKLENKVKEFEDNITMRFSKVVNENEDIVQTILDKANIEKQLFDKKKILIWGETDSSFIEGALKKIKFNHKNITKDATQDFDVLFINNLTGSLVDADMIVKAKGCLSNEKICLFYYNTTRKNFPNDKLDESMQDRINFATNAAQIYGNLLNTLKYQDKICKS